MKLQADVEEEVLVHIYRQNWEEKKKVEKRRRQKAQLDKPFHNLEGTECISGH